MSQLVGLLRRRGVDLGSDDLLVLDVILSLGGDLALVPLGFVYSSLYLFSENKVRKHLRKLSREGFLRFERGYVNNGGRKSPAVLVRVEVRSVE